MLKKNFGRNRNKSMININNISNLIDCSFSKTNNVTLYKNSRRVENDFLDKYEPNKTKKNSQLKEINKSFEKNLCTKNKHNLKNKTVNIYINLKNVFKNKNANTKNNNPISKFDLKISNKYPLYLKRVKKYINKPGVLNAIDSYKNPNNLISVGSKISSNEIMRNSLTRKKIINSKNNYNMSNISNDKVILNNKKMKKIRGSYSKNDLFSYENTIILINILSDKLTRWKKTQDKIHEENKILAKQYYESIINKSMNKIEYNKNKNIKNNIKCLIKKNSSLANGDNKNIFITNKNLSKSNRDDDNYLKKDVKKEDEEENYFQTFGNYNKLY